MFVSLIVAAAVAPVDFEAAVWLRTVRRQFRDVRSLLAEYTVEDTPGDGRPGGTTRHRLRLARAGDDGMVGDLTAHLGDALWSRYTLWAGKVYEARYSQRHVVEYEPADGDLIRFAADNSHAALAVLTARPPAVRLTHADQHRNYFRLGLPPERLRATVSLAVPTAHHATLPAGVPDYVWVDDPPGGRRTTVLLKVLVNAGDGPTAEDIADPTRRLPGWTFGSMAAAFRQAEKGRGPKR